MQKRVIAVIIVVALVAAAAYGAYLCGVESQRGTITQITNELGAARSELETTKTELEGVERDKKRLVAVVKRNNLQRYFEGFPLPFRMELDKPLTLAEQNLLDSLY